MAEGWKQIWEDIRNALRGTEAKGEAAPSLEPSESQQSNFEDQAIEDDQETIASSLIEESKEALEPSGELILEPSPTPGQVWMRRLYRGGSYLLMAIILLAAFWFAGGYRWAPDVYFWWLRLTAPKPPASDVVATFDGGQITIADVDAHLKLLLPEEYQSVAGSPETLLAVIEDMVTDELTRRWAAARQPDQDETFSHTMQHIN